MTSIDRQLSTGRRLVVAVLAAVFLVFNGMSLYQAAWSNAPSTNQIGFAFAPDAPAAVVEKVFQSGDQPSPAQRAGLAEGDVILAVEDASGRMYPMRGYFDAADAFAAVHWNEPWTLVVARRGAPGTPVREVHLAVPPTPAPPLATADLLLLAGIYVMLPLLALAAAVLIGFARPADDDAFLASLLFFCLPTIFLSPSGSMPAAMRSIALLARCCGPMFAGYLVLRFFLRFPSPSPLDRRFPWLRPLFFWLALCLAFYRVVILFSGYLSFALLYKITGALGPTLTRLLQSVQMPLLIAMIGLGLVALMQNTRRPAASPGERRRMVLLATGAVLGLVPLGTLVFLFTTMGTQPLWLALVVTATVWTFPATFVYAVIRHQVFGIRLILRRGLQYAFVTRGVVVLGLLFFGVLYFTIGPLVDRLTPQGGHGLASLGSAVVALTLAGALREMNRRIMPAIDRAFFRDAYDARRILSELSDAVRLRAADPDALLDFVAERLHRALHPVGVAIALRDHDPGAAATGPFGRRAPADDAHDDLFSCAVVSISPDLGHGGPRARALQGAALEISPTLRDLLARAASAEPQTIDVLSAVEHDRRIVPPNSVRWQQLVDELELFEPLAARLVVPLATSERLLGILVLGEKLSEEPYTREDRELLLSVAGQVAIALDYAELIGQTAERERMRRELEIAQEVQAQLFPQRQPQLTTLRYTGLSQPARILGGDYFDFIPVAPHQLGLALADISGKGISAALLMASVQGALRSHAAEWGERVTRLVADVNAQLCASSSSNRYATFFYGLYDDERRTLSYVNAGHNPPLLVRAGMPAALQAVAHAPAAAAAHTAALVAGTNVEKLTVGGTVIGMFNDVAFEQQTVELHPGDVLVIYSDGVTDTSDRNDEAFGERRLVELVSRHAHLEPEGLRNELMAALERHASGVPFEDDVTFIVAKVNPTT